MRQRLAKRRKRTIHSLIDSFSMPAAAHRAPRIAAHPRRPRSARLILPESSPGPGSAPGLPCWSGQAAVTGLADRWAIVRQADERAGKA